MSKAMREKYGKGIVSESFIDTGMPKHYEAAMERYREEQKDLAAYDEKLRRKAEKKAATAFRKKSRKGKEYKMVFV